MEDLIKLESRIVDRLHEIRNKENKTLNEREEYKKLQEQLSKVYTVKILIKEMKEEN